MLNTVNIAEIIIVNSIGIILMIFLRVSRIENAEKRLLGDKLFDVMIWITVFGCLAEILTFLIDGKIFAGSRILSYALNSFCFIGTCSVGFLWCLFVEYRIYNSVKRIRKRAKILAIPFIVDIVMNLINLNGCGIIFRISKDNVYQRGSMVATVYIILFIYFTYSLCLVDRSKKSDLRIQFFPVYYFVVPCILGTIVQGLVYGITLGWTAVAIAFMFVHIETQSLNSFVDSLSGLYNRSYMDCILSQVKRNPKAHVFGIMIDVNDFKQINDRYGHAQGDQAIRAVGRILSESLEEEGIAVRYAGDEFIILLRTEKEEAVKKTIELIEEKTEAFNHLDKESYKLSLAMGYSEFDAESGDVEAFLTKMDQEMYAAKQQHYQNGGRERRKRKDSV